MCEHKHAHDGLWTHLPPMPWRYDGMTIETYQACPGAPIQVGGSCDHCSTGIMETHWFAGGDGSRFKVGSTCVMKMVKEIRAHKSAPLALREAESKIKKERNRKARERAAARRKQDKETAATLITEKHDSLQALPHPFDWAREQGNTMLDWAEWMLKNGGGQAHKHLVKTLTEIAK